MDIPNWISALAAIISAFVAFVAVVAFLKVNDTKKEIVKVSPDFVIVSSEGKVLKNSRDDISVSINLNDENYENCGEDLVPVYSLLFSKDPEYFEVTTMEGSTVDLKQVGINKYKLIFIASGFGNPVVKCNFKVQIF